MTIEVHGFCDPRFEPLKAAFVANFEADQELGASIAATWRGEPVVDLWAGWADVAKTRPWERDTLTPVFSTTKMMVTLSLLMLVDQGQIDLDAPIATYWPAFAAGGKEAVTVRDLFTHQAGAPGFTPPVSASIFLDWEASAARIAAEPHWFGGERRVIYHGGTYGLIAGELIRRVDGRMPAQFFRDEVSGPAGLDFHYGLAEVPNPSRVAELLRFAAPPGPPPEGLLGRVVGSYRLAEGLTPVMTMNPSNNGLANARSIARGNASSPAAGCWTGNAISRRPWWARPTVSRLTASARTLAGCGLALASASTAAASTIRRPTATGGAARAGPAVGWTRASATASATRRTTSGRHRTSTSATGA